jgi:hypothetical protein
VPFVRPAIVAEVAEAAGELVTIFDPAVAVKVYLLRASPPSSTGAFQTTSSDALRATTVVITGADGGCATSGVAGLEGALIRLFPAALVALIVTV